MEEVLVEIWRNVCTGVGWEWEGDSSRITPCSHLFMCLAFAKCAKCLLQNRGNFRNRANIANGIKATESSDFRY